MILNLSTLIKIIRIILVLFGSVLAGYSLIDIKPEYLLKLTEFKYMLIVNIFLSMGVVGFTFMNWKKDIAMVLVTATCFTIIINVLKNKLKLKVISS